MLESFESEKNFWIEMNSISEPLSVYFSQSTYMFTIDFYPQLINSK